MFRLYIKLRIISILRLLREIGIFRGCILMLVFIVFLLFLVKIENRWIVPALYVLLLWSYHNNRKDKTFLKLQVKNIITFLRKEYCLMASPFILIELVKYNWWEAIGMVLFIIFLPYLREVKLKRSISVGMPFLYQGGMEYIRMFRQCWWIYVLLLFCLIMGIAHENMRLAKICFIIWCLIQSTAFGMMPDALQVFNFKNFKTFGSELWKMNSWNVIVTGIPFTGLIVGFEPTMKSVYFSISVIITGILYLQNLGLFRYICNSNLGLFLLQFILLIPVFIFSSFIPYFIILFIVITIATHYMVSSQFKHIWT